MRYLLEPWFYLVVSRNLDGVLVELLWAFLGQTDERTLGLRAQNYTSFYLFRKWLARLRITNVGNY